MKVTALLASHNRRAKTLACLSSFFGQRVAPDIELDAVLVDDGSVDGTAVAVRSHFPAVRVLTGDGSLFWAGAMALAERTALANGPDHLLWLNDDVVLNPGALDCLLRTSKHNAEVTAIAVGALRDPITGALTYSGLRRRGLHPLRMETLAPSGAPIEVDTFNGNTVLIPRSAAELIGPMDGALVHAAADFDYGLRATDAGVSNLLAPEVVGTCELNTARTPWLDGSMPTRERLRILFGPKGLPPRARARYLMRHGGSAWFIYWLAPYLRTAPSIVRASLSR